MSISSAIQNAQQKVTNAYTAVDGKGGTLPTTQDLSNLPTAINSITELKGETKTVTPTTSQQTITPSSGKNGITQVTVNPVTSSIDSDIIAGNIKSGVNILGVNGTVTELKGETRSVSITSASGNTFTPTSGKNGITSITVTPTNEARTVTPTTSQQTLSVNSGYSGNGTITVNAVTSSIDNNIMTGNIKNGVSILGVTGNYTGTTPTLTTKNITQNGTYNASSDNADGYSSVTVNVSGGSGVGITREVSANGVYQMPASNFTFSLPNNATNVGDYGLAYAFRGCVALTNLDLSSLTNVSGSYALSYAFYNCTGLTSVDLSSLTTVNGTYAMYYAFDNCTNLTNLDLSSLTTISGTYAMYFAFYNCINLTSVDLSSLTTTNDLNVMASTFANCTGLTSLNLSGLTTVKGGLGSICSDCTKLSSVNFNNLQTIGENNNNGGYGHFSQSFKNCNLLTSITFPNLKSIYCTGTSTSNGTFANNNKVQKMYFPKLSTITYGSGASSSYQNASKNVFYGCSSLTELHFAATNQSAIQASAGYSTAWGRGAGNVTIYFDL